MKTKKILCIFLTFVMVLNLMPVTLLRAQAIETSDTADEDVFSALGFDTSVMPEGFDADSTENPYGKDLLTTNEVLEAFILHDSGYRIAGDNTTISSSDITSAQYNSVSLQGIYRSVAAGDFDGDGLAGEMVYVANSSTSFDTPSNLKMYFIDKGGNTYESITLASNRLGDGFDGLAGSEVYWRNILKITTGDFDGDGYSEIAVYVPEYGKVRVDIYKYQITSTMASDGWKAADNWALVWSHAISGGTVSPNMISLCAGDFNRDGIDDLAVSYGSESYKDKYVASNAVVLFGSKTTMLQTSQVLSLGSTDVIRAAFTYGDVDDDGAKDLVLGAEPIYDIQANHKRVVGVYGYDGTSIGLLYSSVMDVVSGEYVNKDDGSSEWMSSNGYDSDYRVSNMMLCNIAVTMPENLTSSSIPYIYLDSVLYYYDSGAFKIEYELDETDINADGTDENLSWYKNGDIDMPWYYEYGAISGDVTGDGKEALITNLIGYSSDIYSPLYKNTKVLFSDKDGKLTKNEISGCSTTCFANTDGNDTVIMKYTGEHYIVYTDPKVLAVIASAPYFQDVADSDDFYTDDLETSFGQTKGSGGSKITTVGFELGGYFSISGAPYEFEASEGFTFEWEKEIANSTEYTVSFNTPGGEDSVAFFSVPTEVYVYELSIPDGEGGYTTVYNTVNIPHTAAVQVLRLDYYESIASSYEELPEISGEVLTHTLGDPSSYPSSSTDYDVITEYSGDWAGLSFGNGSISQEITITKETSNSYNFGSATSVKFGWKNPLTKLAGYEHAIGIYANFNAGGGYSTVDMEGTTISGTIKNMPVDMEQYGYYFAWKLFSYKHTLNKGLDDEYSFPVINYLVKDVTAPPTLPTDFVQDYNKTTDSQVALKWSYNKSATLFYIYRYFDFPEGGGSYLVGTVPASDYTICYDSKGNAYKSYSFINEGLSPYTDYQYQIQVERSKVPPQSGISSILTARTKASSGYPELSITPSVLTVYPDKNETLMVDVANINDYTNDTAMYQWQKLTNGVWTDLDGANSAAIVFYKSGTSDAGSYRCRVNVITKADNTAFSVYTDTAVVDYSKRSVDFSDISAYDSSLGTTLSLNVINAHSDSGSIPSGTVTFYVENSNMDISCKYSVELDSSGKAEVDIESLPQGIYEVSAYYSGSRIFKSGFTDAVQYLSGIGNGYYLDVADNVTYGDTVPFQVDRISKDESGNITSSAASIIGYEIYVDDVLYSGDEYRTSASNSFYAGTSGSILLRVYYDDSGTTKYIEEPVTIQKQSIILEISNRSGILNEAVNPLDMTPSVLSGRIADSDKTDFFSNVIYTYRNTAGTAVDSSSVPSMPGYYTVSGKPNNVLTYNYDITMLDGSYIVTGAAKHLSASMRTFENIYNGTLYMLYPDGGSTSDGTVITSDVVAGTRVILGAIPDSGYAIYDWYINGVSQGSTKSTIAHTMLAEDTSIEVQFVIKQNNLTFGTAGDSGGGMMTCLTDGTLSSGNVITQGAEVMFKAVPSSGYHFVEWRYTEMNSDTIYSDGISGESGSSTYTVTMPGKSVSLYAVFERDSYVLTLSDGLKAVFIGDHDDNSSTPDQEITINSGDSVKGDTVITVIPNVGYTLDGSSAWLAVGSQGTAASDNSSYTLTITEDTYVQISVNRSQYAATLGFSDINKCSGGTITYRIDNSESVTISGDSYTTPVEVSIPGGASFYVSAAAGENYEFSKWIKTSEGIDTDIASQEVYIESVAGNLSLEALLKDKNKHTISLGTLTETGASYSISVNGGTYYDANAGDVISATEGDYVSVRVNVPTGKVVGYWTVDNQSLQASSSTYTFENITEDHTVAPVFTSMTYCTVSWHGISASTNGCTIVPEDDYLSLVPAGGSYQFTVATVDGISVENVYANGSLLTPENGVYTISDIMENQSITIAISDLGIMVDGIDIKNISGNGWKYDINTNVLTLSTYNLTVSGSMKDPDQKFSIVLDSNVSTVTFENLSMSAINVESAISCLRSAGAYITLIGENSIELKNGEAMDNQYVLSAGKLTFSDQGTGTLDLTIDIPNDTSNPNPASVCGIFAESLAMKGGTVNIFAKNGLDRIHVNDDFDVCGIRITGTNGVIMSGGKLNIEAYAYNNPDNEYTSMYSDIFPDVYGIYLDSGSMAVTGGDIYVLVSGSMANCESCGIKLCGGTYTMSNNCSVAIDAIGGASNAWSYGIKASCVDVSGGLLSVDSSCSVSKYAYNATSCGISLADAGGSLTNSGGTVEIYVADGTNYIPLENVTESNWTLGDGIVITSGYSEFDASLSPKSDYLNLSVKPNYLKVCAGSAPVAENVTISIDGGAYESIYPVNDSTTASGIGWTYDGDINTLMLNDLTKSYTITGTDNDLNIITDNNSYGTADITLDNLHAAQLSLIGKKLTSYTDVTLYSDADLTVLGENTLYHKSSSLTGSAIYVENFVNTTIAGDGVLKAVNSNAGGYAIGMYNDNVTFFENAVTISIEGATISLYGGKAAAGAECWYGDLSSNRTSVISVPYELFSSKVLKAEAGLSPNDASELASFCLNMGNYEYYENRYLKIYSVYSAPTVNPTSATFDINGDTDKTFDVTYPKLGATLYKMSTVSMNGTPISSSTYGIGIYASSSAASIILGKDYLDGCSVGGHKLAIVFENNDIIEIPITIIDSTKPAPNAVITVTPGSSTIYKGESIVLAAELTDLVSIDDETLEWTLTGETSSETRIVGNGRTATLYCGSDETSSEINISAKLFYYQDFAGISSIAVETVADKVTIEPSSATLYYKTDGGNTKQFSAIVTAINNDTVSQNVVWKLWGNTKLATTISPDGLLTVSKDETGYNGLITVKAVSSAYPYVISNIVNVNLSTEIDSGQGSGSGSGGGSGTPAIGSPITVYYGNNITGIEVKQETSGGISEANITSDMVDAVLAKAAEENADDEGDIFEITVNSDEGAHINVTIPNDLFGRIVDETDMGIRINSSTAAVYFDENAVEAINEASQVNSISISFGEADKDTLTEEQKEMVADRPVYEFSIISGDIAITDFKDGTATVTIPYTLKPGENPNAVVIYYLDSDNQLKTVNGYFDSTINAVTFTTNHFSVFIIGYNEVTFNDMLKDAWYKDAVDFIAARGIINGTGNDSYSPDSQLTRGQFMVMLMRAYDMELTAAPGNNFADAGNTYYTNYLAAAKSLGIAKGVGDNRFEPDKAITRQEMMVLLYNTLSLIGELPKESETSALENFRDADQVAAWAKGAVELLTGSEIISGYDGQIAPAQNMTRAQMAQVLYNLFKR